MMQTEVRVMGQRFFLTLLIGISAGCSLAYILLTSTGFSQDNASHNYRESARNLEEDPIIGIGEHSQDETPHKDEDRTIADKLYKKVKVLCWVMTQPEFHELRAKLVKETWGKRCNILLFMSTEEDPTLPSIKLPVTEGRGFLWAKTKAAFRYVYEHHRRDADWFMKADDDTYVVLENLRYMLADYNPKAPIYFGCRFKHYTPQGYMSGGAGYVLSRRALYKFVNKALPSPNLCRADDQGAEDAEMGKCMHNIGVRAMDSRDEHKRGRFFPFIPQNHLFPYFHKDYWYWKAVFYPTDEGLDCCSDHTISFHYVNPKLMLLMDYLIYHLRPYGIKHGTGRLPKLLSRGTFTDLLGGSDETEWQRGSNKTELLGGGNKTELLGGANKTELLGGGNETELLGGSNETEWQRDNNETELLEGSNETGVLGGGNGTELLGVSNETELLGGSNKIELLGGSNDMELLGSSIVTKLLGGSNNTELLGGSNDTELVGGSNATELLGGSNDTELLGGSNATELLGGSNDTELLGGSNATELLGGSNATKEVGNR